jgi:hypothetical protein
MLVRRCFIDESRNVTGIINQGKYPRVIGDAATRVQHCGFRRRRPWDDAARVRASLADGISGIGDAVWSNLLILLRTGSECVFSKRWCRTSPGPCA